MKTAYTMLMLTSIAAACGGDAGVTGAGQQPRSAGQLASATSEQTGMDEDFQGCPDAIPALAPGLRAVGERFALQLVAAMPAAPERFVGNTWTLDISSANGEAAADATITRGQTFMPIHGHDGRVTPDIQALSVPGRFQVERLTFTMRGPWEVRLWPRSPSLAEEEVVFHVCVAQ